MQKLKFVLFSAIGGFFLSLFFGFFSHSGPLKVILTAIICGISFGLLGGIIQFLYKKFLEVETSSEYDSETGSKPANPVGGTVDFVVQDEDLEQTGNSNHYEVGDNHQMLNDSDISKNNFSENANYSSGEFVPLRNKENFDNISGTEAVSNNYSNPVSSANKAAANFGASNGNLDILPDMGDFVTAKSSSSSDESDDSDVSYNSSDDSSFVQSINTSGDNPAAEIQDASLMAKAISSILADES